MSKRTSSYKKDNKEENKLERLNHELEQLEIERISNSTSPQYPITFIVGAPRSATTLTHQLMAQTGKFSYITNFIARFWKAPSLGAEMANTLGIYQKDSMSYESDFGRTKGWIEPHQFNYFWKKWLRYDANHQMNRKDIEKIIDQDKFLRQLGAIEHVDKKPILFKSLYTGMQLPYLKDTIEDIRVIVTLRHPIYQAQSNLTGRRAFFGDETGWFSLKPPEYHQLRDLDPFEQVVAQIYYSLIHIENGLTEIPSEDFAISYYDDFMGDTHSKLEKWVQMVGQELTEFNEIPPKFEVRNSIKLNDTEFEKLSAYVDKYFGADKEEVPFEQFMRLNDG